MDATQPPQPAVSERERMLEEKLGSRTIMLAIIALVAVIELFLLVHSAMK